MNRVLLLNDHPLLRQALRRSLETFAGLEVVADAEPPEPAAVDAPERPPTGDGGSGVELAPAPQAPLPEADVVVIDAGLNVTRTIERVREIRARLGAVRILALTLTPTAIATRKLHAAGVEAVLDKSAPVEELVAAIDTPDGT